MEKPTSITNTVTNTVMNTVNLAKTKINNMDDNFVIFMVTLIMTIIIIIVIIYKIYINNLQSSEEKYMNNLYSEPNKYINSIDKTYTNRFGDYYINTAYNACSGGNYKNDFVSLDVLKAIIKQGVRGLDFAIYNEGETPVIATSTSESSYVKETYNSIRFVDLIDTINNYAFSDTAPNKTDPIILHLRIKSNNKLLYDNMATIFGKYSNKILGNGDSFADRGQNFGNTPLSKLIGKIVIVVDGLNKTYEESPKFLEYVNLVSNSNYMWSFKFFDILNTYEPEELTNHNKSNMTIVLPNLGNNPDNPSALLSRQYGCQMVAMRYQTIDSYLLENIKFFDENKHAFVLKPEELRAPNNVIAKPTPQNPENSYKTRTYTNNLFNFNY